MEHDPKDKKEPMPIVKTIRKVVKQARKKKKYK